MTNYVNFKPNKLFFERVNQPYFYEKVYFSLIEDGIDIPFGVFYSKIKANGTIKVLKSIGLYNTVGTRSSKIVNMHPKLLLIINTTIQSPKEVANTIIDLFNGFYLNIDKFNILDTSVFYNLKDYCYSVSEIGYYTYLIYNPSNDLYKIGKTKDIGKRISQLKLETNNNLELIGFLAEDIESLLHIKYNNFRKYGEWFMLTIDSVLDICNDYNFQFKKKQHD